MANADMPAMPVVMTHTKDGGLTRTDKYEGLTKREELAARNMAAILSSLPHWESMGYIMLDDSDYAKQAVDAADALLAELDK